MRVTTMYKKIFQNGCHFQEIRGNYTIFQKYFCAILFSIRLSQHAEFEDIWTIIPNFISIYVFYDIAFLRGGHFEMVLGGPKKVFYEIFFCQHLTNRILGKFMKNQPPRING